MRIQWSQVLVSLTLGLALGAGLGAWQQGRHLFRSGMDSQGRYQRLLEKFSSKLKLSAEQKSQVGRILETKRLKVEALRAETRPRFEDLRRRTRDEIRKLLTPEQQGKFDAMQEEREARRKKREGP